MKIEPIFKDGEPVCSGENCERWGDCDDMYEAPPVGDPCIPMLRKQRDNAIALAIYLRCCGNCVNYVDTGYCRIDGRWADEVAVCDNWKGTR